MNIIYIFLNEEWYLEEVKENLEVKIKVGIFN